ncbi:MAG: hypothetical protein IKU15_06185 [Clostridia bacterium]|nr:hypothetical protein [Clostridia bacterium]
MSYEHNVYIKRNKDNEDSHVWICGCRDLSSAVRRYMHSVDDEQYRFELTPFEAMKLLAAITADFLAIHMPMWDAYEDFNETVMFEDEENRKPVAELTLESYAILRSMAKGVRDVELSIIDNFEEPFKMERLIGGLTKLVGEMKEDDVLVWTMG